MKTPVILSLFVCTLSLFGATNSTTLNVNGNTGAIVGPVSAATFASANGLSGGGGGTNIVGFDNRTVQDYSLKAYSLSNNNFLFFTNYGAGTIIGAHFGPWDFNQTPPLFALSGTVQIVLDGNTNTTSMMSFGQCWGLKQPVWHSLGSRISGKYSVGQLVVTRTSLEMNYSNSAAIYYTPTAAGWTIGNNELTWWSDVYYKVGANTNMNPLHRVWHTADYPVMLNTAGLWNVVLATNGVAGQLESVSFYQMANDPLVGPNSYMENRPYHNVDAGGAVNLANGMEDFFYSHDYFDNGQDTAMADAYGYQGGTMLVYPNGYSWADSCYRTDFQPTWTSSYSFGFNNTIGNIAVTNLFTLTWWTAQ